MLTPQKEAMAEQVSKAVLITGCSTGIGRATALRLAAGGHNVYASARRLDAIRDLGEQGCKIVALDVCDEASMRGPSSGSTRRTAPSARW